MKIIDIDFKKGNGLIPVIVQDYKTGDVFMLGYMNNEALQKTLATGLIHFWSRSREKNWLKGEESGNKLKVKEIFKDCDNDTLLIKVTLLGKNVCHTGNRRCFFQQIKGKI